MIDWNEAFEKASPGSLETIAAPSLTPIPVKVIDDGKLDKGNIVEQLVAGAILLSIGVAVGAIAKSKGLV